jgi:hypothetical protein
VPLTVLVKVPLTVLVKVPLTAPVKVPLTVPANEHAAAFAPTRSPNRTTTANLGLTAGGSG